MSRDSTVKPQALWACWVCQTYCSHQRSHHHQIYLLATPLFLILLGVVALPDAPPPPQHCVVHRCPEPIRCAQDHGCNWRGLHCCHWLAVITTLRCGQPTDLPLCLTPSSPLTPPHLPLPRLQHRVVHRCPQPIRCAKGHGGDWRDVYHTLTPSPRFA
jgi:hypothetical protein